MQIFIREWDHDIDQLFVNAQVARFVSVVFRAKVSDISTYNVHFWCYYDAGIAAHGIAARFCSFFAERLQAILLKLVVSNCTHWDLVVAFVIRVCLYNYCVALLLLDSKLGFR